VEGLDTIVLVHKGSSLVKQEIGAESPSEMVYLQFTAIGRGTTPLNLAYRSLISDDSGEALQPKISFAMQVVIE